MSGGTNKAADGAAVAPEERAAPAAVRSSMRRALTAAVPGLLGYLAEERPRFVNWLPVLFGLGIWCYFALPSEPTLAAASLPLTFAGLAIAATHRGSATRLAAAALMVGALGFLAVKSRTSWVTAPVLERTLRAVEVTGVIERREPHAKRGERLTLRLLSVEDVPAGQLPARARIRVMSAAGDAQPGDTVRLTATLSPPAPPALPSGYDFARAAFFQQIGAVGYALKAPQKISPVAPAEPNAAAHLRAGIETARENIRSRIQAALPGERGAMAAALITGERGGITQQTTDAYRDSGLIHILSISGLHMAIMAGAVFGLIRFLLAAIPALALTRPIKKWAAFGGALGAILYYAISGGTAATLRSAIMMVVMFIAIMLGRPAIAMRNVAIAALLILAVYPESLLDTGFQMSFAAVAALVASYEAARGRLHRTNFTPGPAMRMGIFLGGIVFSTVIAGLAVTPLSIYHFHAMQHYAPLANLIAVPVCNVVVMPAALATLVAMPFGLEFAPLWVMGLGIDAMGWVAGAVAGLPGAVTRIQAIPAAAFALVLAGGLWLVLWQKRWRMAGIPLIACGLALASSGAKPDILIGREGALVAVRGTDGRFFAHAERPSTFELQRWLETDGDGRDPKEVRAKGSFRCDALGCVAVNEGSTVAISRHPGSTADDCAKARVLVVNGPRPARCTEPNLVYDRDGLKRSGTIALYRTADGTYGARSVAQARGNRPWSQPPPPRRTRREITTEPDSMTPNAPASHLSAIGRYAAPKSVQDAFDEPLELRSDVEDEEGP